MAGVSGAELYFDFISPLLIGVLEKYVEPARTWLRFLFPPHLHVTEPKHRRVVGDQLLDKRLSSELRI